MLRELANIRAEVLVPSRSGYKALACDGRCPIGGQGVIRNVLHVAKDKSKSIEHVQHFFVSAFGNSPVSGMPCFVLSHDFSKLHFTLGIYEDGKPRINPIDKQYLAWPTWWKIQVVVGERLLIT